MKNFLKKIKKKISLWNEYHNPFYPWYKVRKKFPRPKCHFIYGKDIWFFGMPVNKKYYNPIISINTSALGWKTKYRMFRHEWDPYIDICLFRKYHIMWVFNYAKSTEDRSNSKESHESYTDNIYIWESMLEYLYGKKL